MSAWRRKAIALFPELQPNSESWSTIYQVFFDLFPFEREAQRRTDNDRLRRVYGFSEWCLRQKSKDLWNAAAVCFYENIFDDPTLWKSVIAWLSPYVLEECKDLWRNKIPERDFENLKKSVPYTTDLNRRNVYLTGEIESL